MSTTQHWLGIFNQPKKIRKEVIKEDKRLRRKGLTVIICSLLVFTHLFQRINGNSKVAEYKSKTEKLVIVFGNCMALCAFQSTQTCSHLQKAPKKSCEFDISSLMSWPAAAGTFFPFDKCVTETERLHFSLFKNWGVIYICGDIHTVWCYISTSFDKHTVI